MPRILSFFSKSGVIIHDDRYRIILSLRRSTKGVRFVARRLGMLCTPSLPPFLPNSLNLAPFSIDFFFLFSKRKNKTN